MTAVNLKAFGGMIPAIDDRLLPDQAAAYSKNAWLYSGALIGLPKQTLLHTCADTSVAGVFRLPQQYGNAEYLFDSTWLEFENPDTDVIRAPVFGDTHDRYYWASTSGEPKYNTRARIENGDPPWLLGVPTPGVITVGASGGVASETQTRSYVVTWVSAYGEEGATSIPYVITGKQDDTFEVTLPEPDADDMGVDRNLTHARVYRTVTSLSGVATYFLVAQVPIDDETYDDVLTDAQVSSNSELESSSWTPPPVDLEGFTMMPNGIVAAWRGNELWFSEPYRPHAWPAAYVLTVEFPIVGMGVANQSLVVCTIGYPIAASGVNPAFIKTSTLTTFEPCISRSSIVSAPEGVYFASPNGLIRVSNGAALNVTRNLITKDRWQQLTKASKLRAAMVGGAYYAFGSVAPNVFQADTFQEDAFAQEDYSGAFIGILVDPTQERVAFNVLDSEEPVSNIANDIWSGAVFVIKEGVVNWIDFTNLEPEYEVALWRSKIFHTGVKANIGAMKVYFSVPAGTATLNPVPNTALVQELAEDQYGLVRVYADERHIMTRELRTSGEMFRLPDGFKAEYWQVELETRVRVHSLQMASTAKELRNV